MPKKALEYRPMRVQARPGSHAERAYYDQSGLASGRWAMPKAIAPGIDPSPLDDLMFHGGKVVPQMEFQNVYLGGSASWKPKDISSIDAAITLAMRDRRLNNVLAQYFPGATLSCDARASLVLEQPPPSVIDEPDVQRLVTQLYDKSQIAKSDLDSAIFNLILPRRAILRLDDSSSQQGLGGYHGSLHIKRAGKTITLYYSANVYSEIEKGKENGIVAFDAPWKNVVATLYHELNEFRTDADINDAIAKNDDDFLGWTSRRGHEIGDQPIFVAQTLDLVFKEISAAGSRRRIPVQFLYSNAVHGAEGPIAKPHAKPTPASKKKSSPRLQRTAYRAR